MSEPEAVLAVLLAFPGTQVVQTTDACREAVRRLVERGAT